MACTNRQSYYCTWWWWQPSRHRDGTGGVSAGSRLTERAAFALTPLAIVGSSFFEPGCFYGVAAGTYQWSKAPA